MLTERSIAGKDWAPFSSFSAAAPSSLLFKWQHHARAGRGRGEGHIMAYAAQLRNYADHHNTVKPPSPPVLKTIL